MLTTRDAAKARIRALLTRLHRSVHTRETRPAQAPQREPALAVCMVHQQAPSVIAVRRQGNVMAPAALAGATLIGHASDVALQTFGAYAAACGLDAGAIHLQTVDAPMATLLQTLLELAS